MSHYFESPQRTETRRHEIAATIWGRDYRFTSAPGVFSSHRLDLGTAVLLRETDPPPASARRLCDLGCGFGPIATALAVEAPAAVVDAIDVNDLALQLTRENAERHGVADRVRTLRPDQVEAAAQGYDEIFSNPPIRIGKKALHALLRDWLPRLAEGGQAWLVVGKSLGADSLQGWLNDQGFPTERVASAKGFRVLRAQRN